MVSSIATTLIILSNIKHSSIAIYSLHTVKEFQVLLFNTNNSILIIIIPSKRLNSSIWPIDETLTGTTTLDPGRPESKGNERILGIPQTLSLEPHHQVHFSVISRTLNGYKYCYLSLTILLDIIHLFAHS